MGLKRVLDPNLPPTKKVTEANVKEALAALQVEGVNAAAVAASPLGKILVAVVQHLARGGFVTLYDEDEEPPKTKKNPLGQRGVR